MNPNDPTSARKTIVIKSAAELIAFFGEPPEEFVPQLNQVNRGVARLLTETRQELAAKRVDVGPTQPPEDEDAVTGRPDDDEDDTPEDEDD